MGQGYPKSLFNDHAWISNVTSDSITIYVDTSASSVFDNPGADYYYVSCDGESSPRRNNGSSYTFTGLQSDTRYNIQLDVLYSAGYSGNWGYDSTTARTEPEIVPTFYVTNITHYGFRFNVQSIPPNKYYFRMIVINNSTGAVIYDNDTNRYYRTSDFAYDIDGLQPETQYRVNVIAYSYSSGGGGSVEAGTQYIATVKEPKHTFYTSNIVYNGFRFNVQNIVSGKYYFRFFVIDNATGTVIYDNDKSRYYATGNFSYDITGLKPETQYRINVYAYSDSTTTSGAVMPDAQFLTTASLATPYYIYNAGSWRRAQPYIYNAGGWKKVQSYMRNGGNWRKS